MKTSSRFLAIGSMVALAATATLNAQTDVVNWGGDYVSANQNLVRPTAVTNGLVVTYTYSSNTAITPVSGYTAPAGRTGPIYGAWQVTSLTNVPVDIAQSRIANNAAGDRIYIISPSGTNTQVQGLIFYNKQDFLNGYSNVTLSLNGVVGSMNIAAVADGQAIRYAVQSGGSWYLSETNKTTAGSFSNVSLQDQNWGVWDPSTTPFGTVPATFDTLGTSITDVSAFGFYFQIERATSASIELDSFVIAVPEPSTIGLLGLSAGALLLFRLRARKRS